jgi:hypothetical protein
LPDFQSFIVNAPPHPFLPEKIIKSFIDLFPVYTQQVSPLYIIQDFEEKIGKKKRERKIQEALHIHI